MTHSRSTLSLVTVLLVLGGLGAGVAWRLLPEGEADAQEEAAEVPEGVELPPTSAASQFSTDLPQPVVGATVMRDTLWIRVSAGGLAEASRRTTVTSQVAGVVRDLPVRENQRVGVGARLLQIDSTEYALSVAQARADVRSAQIEFEQLTLFDDEIEDPAVREERSRIARTRSGLDQQEVSLSRALLELERTLVSAPFDGLIADVQVVEGEHVGAGEELMTVVDLDPIKVEVRVLEKELGLLAEGRRAEVTFAAYPGETFVGRIETMNPVVDPETSSGRVTVMLPNRDHRIKPGMYAEVTLDAEALPDRTIVPRAAILQRGTGELRPMLFVYEEEADGTARAKWRYVNPGRESDTQVEILPEGPEDGFVEPGEIVLVDGHHYLAHDSPVRLVENVAAEGGRPGR